MKKYLIAILAIAIIAVAKPAAAYTVYGPAYGPAPVVYYVPQPPISRPYPMAMRYYNAPMRYAAPRYGYGQPYGYYGYRNSRVGDITSLISLGLITGGVILAATR